MQFWKGQRVLVRGVAFGTVYQDQGLDQTVKVVLDRRKSVVESLDPRAVALIASKEEEDAMTEFINRRYLP